MTLFKNINRSDFFVCIWSIYMLQGLLYPQGIINQLLQLIMIVWGLIVFYRYVFSQLKLPTLLKSVSILCLMYIVYGVVNILFGREDFGLRHVSDYEYLRQSLNSLLPIFVFYDFSRRGLLTYDRIKRYMIFFIPLFIVLFMRQQQLMLMEFGQEETTNNEGYMFVSLLAYVYFFYKRPLSQYIMICILMVFVILSVKRGAILIFMLGAIYFLFTPLKKVTRRKKFVNILLSLTLVAFAIYFIQSRMSSSEYFMSRLESTIDGNTSGRYDIYHSILNEVTQEKNIFRFLFGRGANSTIAIAGNYAHQDWLETLCNNGIIGCCIVLYFFISLISLLIKSYRTIKPPMFDAFITLAFVILAKTMFSMSIQNLDLSQSLLLGFLAFETRKHNGLNVPTSYE